MTGSWWCSRTDLGWVGLALLLGKTWPRAKGTASRPGLCWYLDLGMPGRWHSCVLVDTGPLPPTPAGTTEQLLA